MSMSTRSPAGGVHGQQYATKNSKLLCYAWTGTIELVLLPITDARQVDQEYPQCMSPGMIDRLQCAHVDYAISNPRWKHDMKQSTQKKALINNQPAYVRSNVEQELR